MNERKENGYEFYRQDRGGGQAPKVVPGQKEVNALLEDAYAAFTSVENHMDALDRFFANGNGARHILEMRDFRKPTAALAQLRDLGSALEDAEAIPLPPAILLQEIAKNAERGVHFAEVIENSDTLRDEFIPIYSLWQQSDSHQKLCAQFAERYDPAPQSVLEFLKKLPAECAKLQQRLSTIANHPDTDLPG